MPRAQSSAARAAAVPARRWNLSVLSFLERHSLTIAIALTIIASVRIVATYRVFNHTFDEPIHVACGMEWLDKGAYTCEPQHPPLARVAAAAGAYLSGIRSQGIGKAVDRYSQLTKALRSCTAGITTNARSL